MSNDDKKAVVALGSAIVGFVLLFMFMTNLDMNSPGQCYETFKTTYSYGYRLGDLDKMVADNELTNGECSKVNEIYIEARANRDKAQQMNEIRKLQKAWH